MSNECVNRSLDSGVDKPIHLVFVHLQGTMEPQ